MYKEEIYRLLKYNDITELDLSVNKTKNIDKLAECLKYNSTLKKLYLRKNKIINIYNLDKRIIII